VVVSFGAGHLTPGMLDALREALRTIPVLITGRPDRAQMLFTTYGFDGAEPDLRGAGAICVPFLSPVAARIALLCCLGAGLAADQIASALSPWDARLR
jgi:L-asparaginase/Glu-tRNA(Gln) amidotransferase subunit D